MLQSWIGRERASWGKREKKGEDAPIVHRRQRGVLGGEVIKQRKMLQVRSGSEKASWGKSSGMGKTPQ